MERIIKQNTVINDDNDSGMEIGRMKKSTLSNEYISSFCLEMSLLIHAGIGLEDGIYLLIEDETDKKMKKILEKITDILGEGRPLSEAIREVGCFPSYVCDMVETGEQTGRIEQSFQSLSAYYDRQMQLNDQVRSAILYPSILMVLMMVIIVVLLVKVLPIFNQVYTQLGGALSGTARILLNLGKFLGSCMPVLCGSRSDECGSGGTGIRKSACCMISTCMSATNMMSQPFRAYHTG